MKQYICSIYCNWFYEWTRRLLIGCVWPFRNLSSECTEIRTQSLKWIATLSKKFAEVIVLFFLYELRDKVDNI